jgi:hypothetical protein
LLLQDWLGLVNISPAALWSLFFAYCASVLQLHIDTWLCCTSPAHAHSDAANAGGDDDSLDMPLLSPRVASGGGREGGAGGVDSTLWRPLDYSQQHTWRWADWMRYFVYRWGGGGGGGGGGPN